MLQNKIFACGSGIVALQMKPLPLPARSPVQVPATQFLIQHPSSIPEKATKMTKVFGFCPHGRLQWSPWLLASARPSLSSFSQLPLNACQLCLSNKENKSSKKNFLGVPPKPPAVNRSGFHCWCGLVSRKLKDKFPEIEAPCLRDTCR